MKITRPNFRFYLAVHVLVAALGLFFLAKEDLPTLPDPLWMGLTGTGLALVYLVLISGWAFNQCVRNNYSFWLTPLSGGLAGIVLRRTRAWRSTGAWPPARSSLSPCFPSISSGPRRTPAAGAAACAAGFEPRPGE
jgi:hypothetical protein